MTYGESLLHCLRSDSRIVVLTAENWGPVVPVGLSGSERFIDTGINEQALVGMAAGLALRGRIPVVHALACFLTMRAYEFIRTDVGLGALPVKLIGSLPGLLSEGNGPTHQAIEDLALMRTIPNMRVFCPATMDELVRYLPVILDSPFPWYVRFNDRGGFSVDESITEGRAVTFGDGRDVGIVTCGFLVEEAIAAAQLLAESSVAATVMNLRFVHPLDTEGILTLARRCRIVVTVEDHFAAGGIGELVASRLHAEGIHVPLLAIALQNWFPAGPLAAVLECVGMSAAQIAKRIRVRLER
jgi:transketolase